MSKGGHQTLCDMWHGFSIKGEVHSILSHNENERLSSHKEALKKPYLCEDSSDLTSPNSNRIRDKQLAISDVCNTFKNYFTHASSHCLILHFDCEMKLRELVL